MMKIRRKSKAILSSIFSVILIVSMLCGTVYAEGSAEGIVAQTQGKDLLGGIGSFEQEYPDNGSKDAGWYESGANYKDALVEFKEIIPASDNGGKCAVLTFQNDDQARLIPWNAWYAVEAGKTYILEAYVKLGETHAKTYAPYITVEENSVSNGSGTQLGDSAQNGKIYFTADGAWSDSNDNVNGWVKLTKDFTISTDMKYIKLTIYGTGESGTCYVDGIKIFESTEYTSLQDAIDAAKAGDTITLVEDIVYEGNLVIGNDITLDLKGKTLTASSAATFGGNVIDSGKSGLLKVDSTNCVFSSANTQMPVYNGTDGYVFTNIEPQELNKSVAGTNTFELVFKPSFSETINGLLADSNVDTKISFRIRLDWKENEPVYLEYTPEMVQQVYGNGMAFSIKASGVSDYEDLTITPLVTSDKGIEWTNGSFSNFQ